LPVPAEASRQELAAGIEKVVNEYLLQRDRVALLSRSAIESRPTNPFPYFFYEFGARWLVESELQGLLGKTLLTVAIVDARSGIVLFQSTATIDTDGTPTATTLEPILQPLTEFIDSQLD